MRRRLSKEEKKLLKRLIQSDEKTVHLIDFIAENFPRGKFEISTFQQAISIEVTQDELASVMNHLTDRLSLLKSLEQSGLINLWSQLPLEDNTKTCGQASDEATVQFIPDIQLASELLKYGNYEIGLSNSLIEWSKKNFRSPLSSNSLKYLMYALLVVVGVDLLYHVQIIGKNIQSDHRTIVDNNQEVIENQKLNKRIIDSLQSQSKDLVILTNRISSNTENMKDVEWLISRQNQSISTIKNQIKDLKKQLIANNKLIQRTDSLLNLTSR